MPITNATYTSPDWTGYAYPASLAPLPDWMIRGLSTLTAFSLLSAITTAALLSYITYLFITGGAGYRIAARTNQYVILIYCLLIADFQLALGFLISFKWIQENQIYAPSSACIAQAWLTNLGDLASGLFILAIAVHTFMGVVFRRRLESFTFCAGVIGVWIVSVIITAVPIMLHASDIFVVGGSWVTSSTTSFFHKLTLLVTFSVLSVQSMTRCDCIATSSGYSLQNSLCSFYTALHSSSSNIEWAVSEPSFQMRGEGTAVDLPSERVGPIEKCRSPPCT